MNVAGVPPRDVGRGSSKASCRGVSAYAVASRLLDTASQMPRQGVGTSCEGKDRTEAFREWFVFGSLHRVAVTEADRVHELDDEGQA